MLPAIGTIERLRAQNPPHDRIWVVCWYKSGTVSVGAPGRWQQFLPWWDAERMEPEFREYKRGEPVPTWGAAQVVAHCKALRWPEHRLTWSVEFAQPLAECGFPSEEEYMAWLHIQSKLAV